MRIYFCHLYLFGKLKGASLARWLRLAILTLLIFSLSSPITYKNHIKTTSHGVILLFDLSSSMNDEFESHKSKLDLSKQLALEFLHQRKDNYIGLVLAQNNAHVRLPLSLEHGISAKIIKNINGGYANSNSLLDGIMQGINALKSEKIAQKNIVVFSDLRQKPNKKQQKILETLALNNINMYVIAFGGTQTDLKKASKEFFKPHSIIDAKKAMQSIIQSNHPTITQDKQDVKRFFYLSLFMAFFLLVWYSLVERSRHL